MINFYFLLLVCIIRPPTSFVSIFTGEGIYGPAKLNIANNQVSPDILLLTPAGVRMQVSDASLAVVSIKLIPSFNRVKALTSDVSVCKCNEEEQPAGSYSGMALTSSTHPCKSTLIRYLITDCRYVWT